MGDRTYLSSNLLTAEDNTHAQEVCVPSDAQVSVSMLAVTEHLFLNFYEASTTTGVNHALYDKWLLVRDAVIQPFEVNLGVLQPGVPARVGVWNGFDAKKEVSDIEIDPESLVIDNLEVSDVFWPYQEIEVSLTPAEDVNRVNTTVTISFTDGSSVSFEFTGISALPLSDKPQNRFRETIQFKTDITSLTDGGERRICLQSRPRTLIDYKYLIPGMDRIGARSAFTYITPGRVLLVPKWFYAEKVRGVSSGSSSISMNTEYMDLIDGDTVMLYLTDGTFELMEVDEVFSDHITLVDPTTIDAPYDLYVVPVQPAYSVNRPSMSLKAAHAEFDYYFQFLINREIAGGSFPESYGGVPVWLDCFIAERNGSSSGQIFDAPVLEYKPGVADPVVYRDSDHVNNLHNHSFFFDTKEDVWEFRRRLHLLKGRQGKFWVPDYTFHFNLSASASATDLTILVERAGLYDYLSAEGQRADLIIRRGDDIQYVGIDSVVLSDSTTEEITLDAGLDFDIVPEDTRIGFLVLVRLASDEVVINHEPDYATCGVNLIEITE